VYKIDVNGDSIWCKSFGGRREDFGNDIAQDDIGDYYIAGSRDSIKPGKLDAYAFKINSTGNLVWMFVDVLAGLANENEIYNSVIVSQIKPGYSVYTETEYFPNFGIQIKVFEMNSMGYYNNATEYGGILSDEIFKITPTKDKGYAGVGYTNNFNAKLTDVYFLKLDTTLLGSLTIVSIKDNVGNFNLDVFPNPTSQILNIKTDVILDERLFRLFDVLGNEIGLKEILELNHSRSASIDVSNLSNGIYF